MSKLWRVQWNDAHNKTLYSPKEEGTSDTRHSISRNEGQHVKCNEPATEVQIHKAVGDVQTGRAISSEAASGHRVGWRWGRGSRS